jgi:CBS domain-containing protein
VPAVAQDATLEEAFLTMLDRGVTELSIQAADGRAIGALAMEDLLRARH